MTDYPLDWAYANPVLEGMARFKQQPEDFQVYEILPFELTGQGEHLYVQVRKTGQNTSWVARQLAQWAGVSNRDVSFSGLKDRHAVCEQWFSLWLPGQSDPQTELEIEGVELLQQVRHQAKLRSGAHAGNRFVIRLRDCSANAELVDARLQDIARLGVPNYFGPQRFGRNADNVDQAVVLFQKGKQQLRKVKRDTKSILLSSIRSWIFNRTLSERVHNGSWLSVLSGEPLILAGSRSWFIAEGTEQEQQRVDQQDCHPSGPMWGRGRPLTEGQALEFEQGLLSKWSPLLQILEHQGLSQERRPLRLIPESLSWQWQQQDLILTFELPRGSFATSVIREVIAIDENLTE